MLESMQKPTGVVLGTFGVERNMLRFVGQAAHSGSTPIPMRRDAFLAAAADRARVPRDRAGAHADARRRRRLHGRRRQRRAEDRDRGARRLRDLARSARARAPTCSRAMLRDAREASRARGAATTTSRVEWQQLWRIEPRPFDPRARRALRGGGARGNRRRAAAAVRAAARRGRDGAAHAGRDDVRVFVERPVALQGRGHARAAPRDDDPRLPAAGGEDHRPRRGAADALAFAPFLGRRRRSVPASYGAAASFATSACNESSRNGSYLVQSPSRLPVIVIVIAIGCPPRSMFIFISSVERILRVGDLPGPGHWLEASCTSSTR